MKKNISAVISGMGVATAILTNLVEMVKRFGGLEEDIYLLVIPEGTSLMEQFAKMVVEAGRKARNTFKITVDYSQPLAEAIKAGKYDWVNENITREHFPKTREGKKEVAVALLHFGKAISSDEAFAEIKKQGCRAAVLEELLALGAAQPELQRQFPIIALGSVWSGPGGLRFVPGLGRDDAKRRLRLG